MKKINKFCALFLLLATLVLCSSCSLFYENENQVDGICDIGYSKLEKSAYIATVYAEYTPNVPVFISLPSEYDGIKIDKLGGYFGRGVPSPFWVEITNLKDLYPENATFFSADYNPDDIVDETHRVVFCTVMITLPDNLKELYYIENANLANGAEWEEEGTTIRELIVTKYYFILAETNEYFYTENGRLYEKDGTLVDQFIYSDEVQFIG